MFGGVVLEQRGNSHCYSITSVLNRRDVSPLRSSQRKLDEIDRAHAVYTHASQFCDPPRQPPASGVFEIGTGSENTF
jgi:hypothetical protein